MSKEKEATPQGGRVGMKCAQSACEPLCEKGVDKFCIDLMGQLLDGIGKKGTFDLLCEGDGTSCVVHENVLDAYFTGILYNECKLGECVPGSVGNLTMEESR